MTRPKKSLQVTQNDECGSWDTNHGRQNLIEY